MQGKNILNNKYGRLLVTKLNSNKKDNKLCWDCICECGNITTVIGRDLRSGHTKSCGCLHKEVVSKRKNKEVVIRVGKYLCDVCNIKFDDLGKHVRKHNISSEEYYNKYLKTKDNICEHPKCNNFTKYKNFKSGYNRHCSYKCASSNPFIIEQKSTTLEFNIIDNGKGFDKEHHESSGNGLSNMQNRCDELDASLSVESDLGIGSKVKLVLK